MRVEQTLLIVITDHPNNIYQLQIYQLSVVN